MTSFTTLVASLASSVERTTVGSSAVSGDVTELAASVALHSLSLTCKTELAMLQLSASSNKHTIARKMVRSAALVASSRAGSTSKSTTWNETSSISTTDSTCATDSTCKQSWAGWRWARALQCVSIHLPQCHLNIQPSVLVDHSCSNVHWCQLR